MAEQLSNYKCPNCGGPLRFDPETQKLKCEYCDSLFTQEDVDEINRLANLISRERGSAVIEGKKDRKSVV